MKVRLLVPRATAAGPENIGDVIDVLPDEAKRMIAAEQCAPVRSSKRETAAKKRASEKAIK